MTPAQRAALETLVERPLKPEEVAEIDAAGWLDPDARRDDLIAELLSEDRTQLAPYYVDKGDFIVALGLDTANAVLDLLEAEPRYRHAKDLIAKGTLRADLPITLALLQQLIGADLGAAGTFSQAHAEALLALARRPAPIPIGDVSRALNAAGD